MLKREPLITFDELIKLFPHTITEQQFIRQSRKEIIRILNRESPKILLILGPCSIHDLPSAIDYAVKLKHLISHVSDIFFPVMRVHFEKPRTANGWSGMMYDPHLNGSFKINHGIKLTRQLLASLTNLQVPAAAEFLTPAACTYFQDLISWGCIGARTCSSQLHRQMASGLPMPVAFKNNTDGNIDIAIKGALSARSSHSMIEINSSGKANIVITQGNQHSHIVLRGGCSGSNYDKQTIVKTANLLKKHSLPPNILIDCSHDNSNKQYENQPITFQAAIDHILYESDYVRGCILESHLFSGSQLLTHSSHDLKYGVSITDSCMGWEMTEDLIIKAYEKIKNTNPSPSNISDALSLAST